jgi:hypothetical protein
MAALVFVLMMPVPMHVFMRVGPGLVLVLVPVMAVVASLVGVLVLMLVFVVATHWAFTSFYLSIVFILSISPFAVNGSLAQADNENRSRLMACSP